MPVYLLNSAATTNATSVKGAPGKVYTIMASNVNAAARFLKIYDKASAPTVGTDRPIITLPIPATGSVSHSLLDGIAFANGIAIALTTGAADTDTAAVAANEIKVVLSYK